jgi:Flp pilus assembly protein TadG
MKAKGKTRTSPPLGDCSRVGNDSRILRSPSGQSLLEVALLTPILLTLLLGAIEMGRYAYISILVASAARAGATYGAQNLARSADTPGINMAAYNDFQNNGQNMSMLMVNSSTSCGCDNGSSLPTLTNLTNQCSAQSDPSIDDTISTCSNAKGHWVVMVSVTAFGTFRPLFNYPGIPNPLTVSNTATLRVAQK